MTRRPRWPWAWALVGWLVAGWVLALATRRHGDEATRRRGDTATRGQGDAADSLSAISYRPSAISYRPSAISYQPSAIGHALFAIAWAIIPVAIYYLVIRDRSTFASRYISFALPGWLLLAGFALRGWARLGRWTGALAALGLVVILAPGLRGDLFDVRFFREDTRGLVAWLKAETTPDDLILVDQRYPFGLYYERWDNRADGLPPRDPANLAPAQYLFVDINTLADRLTDLIGDGHRRVYWVRWFESDTDPRGAVSFLLEKYGTPLGERVFRGYTVNGYDITGVPRFDLAPGLAGPAADFGNQARMVEAAFDGRRLGAPAEGAATGLTPGPADRPVGVALRWARLADAARPLKATLVLEDADGTPVGRDDWPLLNDRHLALPQWGGDDRPLDVDPVRPDPATPPGTYTLKLAVYDPDTLAQLPAFGEGVEGRFVTLGQVDLAPASTPPTLERLPLDVPADLTWRGVRLLGRGVSASDDWSRRSVGVRPLLPGRAGGPARLAGSPGAGARRRRCPCRRVAGAIRAARARLPGDAVDGW